MEADTLVSLEKEQLIEIILNMKKVIADMNVDFQKVTNLRLYNLEKAQNMALQYSRRDCVEISGIPAEISQESLEDEVIYDESAPWPVAADGTGAALVRKHATLWGNDPASWTAIPPNPAAVLQAIYQVEARHAESR